MSRNGDWLRKKQLFAFFLVETLPMKTPLIIGISAALLIGNGCADRDIEARRTREDAEAKGRAEAARKEMDALPKAFQTPDYFKKNSATKKSDPAPESKKTNP